MAGFDFNTPMMANFPGDGNPFNMALLAQLAANNPGLVSSAAAAQGIPPPDPNAVPVQGQDFNQTPFGAFLTPQMGGPARVGAPAATAPATPGPADAGAAANPWAALSGVKGPQVAAPIFSGGVSGSQKAPEGAAPGAGSAQLNQLIQSLMQQQQPQQAQVRPIGGLGSYIGR